MQLGRVSGVIGALNGTSGTLAMCGGCGRLTDEFVRRPAEDAALASRELPPTRHRLADLMCHRCEAELLYELGELILSARDSRTGSIASDEPPEQASEEDIARARYRRQIWRVVFMLDIRDRTERHAPRPEEEPPSTRPPAGPGYLSDGVVESGHVHAPDAVFSREGTTWRISFGGAETHIRDMKGLSFIRRLLEVPERPVPAVELSHLGLGARTSAGVRSTREELVAGRMRVTDRESIGEGADESAVAAYRECLADLEPEIREAEENNDSERVALLRQQRDALLAEVSRAIGLRGRRRDEVDRFKGPRQQVSKAIARAIEAIEQAHPALGRHLRNAIRTGTICVYRPEHPVPWTF